MSEIRVTVEDLETGETDIAVIADDYLLVCAGSCYLAHTNAYPAKGTHVLTVKGRRDPDRRDSVAEGDLDADSPHGNAESAARDHAAAAREATAQARYDERIDALRDESSNG